MDYIIDSVKNDKFEIPYIKFGTGQKNMIVIPGMTFRPLSVSPKSFYDAYKEFGNDYTVYLFDRKINMMDGYLIEDMASDTLEAIKILGLKDIYLYGASQGGMICQLIAIKYPKLVKKLVLASTSYYCDLDAKDYFDEIVKLCDEKNARSLVSYTIRHMYSEEFLDKYKDGLVMFYSNLNEYEFSQMKVLANAYRKIYTLNDLDKITAKVLIVSSKEDKIFKFENALQMVLKLNCECVLYDDYSHCVYDEALDFKERLKHFFDGH